MNADISRAISSIEQLVESIDSIGSKYRQVQQILDIYHLEAQIYVHPTTIDLTFVIAGAAPYHVDEYTVVAQL